MLAGSIAWYLASISLYNTALLMLAHISNNKNILFYET